MRTRSASRERGAAVIEFALAGIAAVMVLMSTFHLSLIMWNYHTLANAVTMGAQLASVRGRGCTVNGRTCSITVGDLAERIAGEAVGIPSGSLEVVLTTQSGQNRTCNPLSSCFSDDTIWPPSAANDNVPGADVTVTARYRAPFPILMLWPGQAGVSGGSFVLPARSTQRIVF